MMVLEKRLSPSVKINYAVSCNISLYHDTKEVIYRYTQNVHRCISSVCISEYLRCYKYFKIMHYVFLKAKVFSDCLALLNVQIHKYIFVLRVLQTFTVSDD